MDSGGHGQSTIVHKNGRGFAPFRIGNFVLALAVATVLGLSLVGTMVMGRLTEFERAQSAITDWPLSQLEVGMIALIEASQDPSGDLTRFRDRFHTYLGQIEMLRKSPLWGVVAEEGRMQAQLATLKSGLHALTSLVDGPEAALRASRPYLVPRLEDMREEARQIAMTGMNLSTLASDYRQERVLSLVRLMVVGALALIVVLALSFYALARQYRLALANAADANQSNLRLKSTINTALDAIIVCDADKTIIGFNPAAVAVFGHDRHQAIGMPFDALFASPEDDADRQWPIHVLEGARTHAGGGSGRIEMEAVRRSGDRFAVEVSVGMVKTPAGPLYNVFMRDISEQKRISEALAEAYDVALKSGRARSNFLTVMSHEMRTALNGVIGVLELLQTTRLNKRQSRYTEIAARSSDILLRHINDVLDIAMVSAGKLVVQPKPFDLPTLLGEVIDIQQPAALAQKDAVTLEIDPAIGGINGDRMRVEQVMLNLLSNAIKFTRNGRIVVEAGLIERRGAAPLLELAVRDSGCGIAPSDQERIFEEFVALDAAPKTTISGSGLGLSICRHIARAMRGEMGVTSTPGTGSRFWLRLPYSPARAELIAPPAPLPAPLPLLHHAPDVLVIEDNCIARFVARHMLDEAGCQTSEASTGREGIALAAKHRFDLILMDINMPGLDGRETCRAIRRGQGQSSASPIVGLTAHAMPADHQNFIDAGMLMCLTKPLRRRDVEHVVSVVREQAKPLDTATSRAPAPAQKVLDRTVLAELGDIFPAPVLSDRAADFTRQIDAMLSRISAAIAADETQEAADIAHNLAGACAVFGALTLREKLLGFVAACKTGSIPEQRALHAALAPAASAAQGELDHYMRQFTLVDA